MFRSLATVISSGSLLLILALTGAPQHAGAACDDVDPLLLLPIDEECPGWLRDGEAQTAYTIEELTGIINGGAFFYEGYGFVAAAFQNYAGEVAGQPTTLTLSLFNQGTAENAEALYQDPGSGSGDPVDDWTGSGQARMRVAFGIVSLEFWEECFFVSIVVLFGEDDAVPHARCIAESVAERIQGATPTGQTTLGGIRTTWAGKPTSPRKVMITR